jgi:hypothetical protein
VSVTWDAGQGETLGSEVDAFRRGGLSGREGFGIDVGARDCYASAGVEMLRW